MVERFARRLDPVRRAAHLGLLGLGGLAGALACATTPSADRCEIDVVRLETWSVAPRAVDAAFLVRGEAGSRGKTWLAARLADRSYVSGGAIPVGPGSFQAIVALELTGRAQAYVAVLEVAGRRCSDDAKAPAG